MAFIGKALNMAGSVLEGAASSNTGTFEGAAKAAKRAFNQGGDLIRAKRAIASSDANKLTNAIKGMKDEKLAAKMTDATGISYKTGMNTNSAKAVSSLGGFGGKGSDYLQMSTDDAVKQMTDVINKQNIMTPGDKAMTAYMGYRAQAQLRDPDRNLMRFN